MGVPKVLVVFAEGFEEIEGLFRRSAPSRRCESSHGGVGSKEIKGAHGVSVVCDMEVSEAPTDFDCMVCPGGMPGSINLAHSWDVMHRLVELSSRGKLICAICAAPAVVLGPAGLLEGRKAVCYPGQETACPSIEFGAERVVVDGNVVTARGAGCAVEFALAIIGQLFSETVADKIASDIVWK
jgi:4-methyl-5(b-hydroxyethyl)-thiazole monophosphate biosynthesis